MSIFYTVRACDDGELSLVDHDREDEDISDYFDQLDQQPRARRSQNDTMLVRVCRELLPDNDTQSSGEHTADNKTGTASQSRCQWKRVSMTSTDGVEDAAGSDEGIPQSILNDVESDGMWTISRNGTKPGGEGSIRQRRQADGNGTDEYISSGVSEDGEIGMEIGKQAVENMTDTADPVDEDKMQSQNNATTGEPEESNEMFLENHALLREKNSMTELNKSIDVNPNYTLEELRAELMDVDYNYTADNYDYDQEVPFPVLVHVLHRHNAIC